MKPTILLSKMGAVAYTAEASKKRSKKAASAGEQGTTDAVVTHLLKRDDFNLVYFGQWRGDIPDGMTYISSDVVGMDEYCTSREQKERWANDIKAIEPYNPIAYVTIAGYAAGLSIVDNPRVTSVQLCATRYTGPILNILQYFKLPRIVIVNDIRNYPKEIELSLGWDWIRPQALLSQRTKKWSRKMYDVKWDINEVYAAAENWREFVQLPREQKTLSTIVVGHAHMLDGKRLKGFDDIWRIILSDKIPDLKVYGAGWEHFSKYDPEYMVGLIAPDEVKALMSKSKTCPVAITGGELYTNKSRFCLAQNCLPLFYGNGGPYTMDPLGKYLPLDSELRIVLPGDFKRLVEYFDTHEHECQKLIDKMWRDTEPDWSLLDDCIDDVLNGIELNYEKYGGYRRCD